MAMLTITQGPDLGVSPGDGCSCLPAGWWYRPEFIINELNINATITSPAHDESVPLTQQPYTLRGYAYSGK